MKRKPDSHKSYRYASTQQNARTDQKVQKTFQISASVSLEIK